jgi:probable addiction module antidote protein
MVKAVVKTKAAAVPRTKTVAYDVAEQLRTPEEMAAYLDAWLEEAPDDVAGITRALGDIARAKGMSQVARDAGLSRESLYKALSEDGNPSFATVLKVARALGVKFHAQPAPGWPPQIPPPVAGSNSSRSGQGDSRLFF